MYIFLITNSYIKKCPNGEDVKNLKRDMENHLQYTDYLIECNWSKERLEQEKGKFNAELEVEKIICSSVSSFDDFSDDELRSTIYAHYYLTASKRNQIIEQIKEKEREENCDKLTQQLQDQKQYTLQQIKIGNNIINQMCNDINLLIFCGDHLHNNINIKKPFQYIQNPLTN